MEDSLGALSAPYGLDYWREKDARHEFPTELWEALGRNGWLGISIPEEYGGQGLPFLDAVFVVESACRAGGGSTLSQLFMATLVFGGETIRRHGSDELKQLLLPGIAEGTIDFCMALTEPDAGSDTFATATTAVKSGNGLLRPQRAEGVDHGRPAVAVHAGDRAHDAGGEERASLAGTQPLHRRHGYAGSDPHAAGEGRHALHSLQLGLLRCRRSSREPPGRRTRHGLEASPRHAEHGAPGDGGGLSGHR